MDLKTPTSSSILGRLVRDEYGRLIGRVVSFLIGSEGEIKSVIIEHDGTFTQYPINQIKVEDDDVIFISPLKVRAEALCNKFPLMWRRRQILDELLREGKITLETFKELQSDFDSALNQLREEAKTLLNDLDKLNAEKSEWMRTLSLAAACLQIEHEAGRIGDDTYRRAVESIGREMDRIAIEKKRIEEIKDKISNLMLGELEESEEHEAYVVHLKNGEVQSLETKATQG